MNIDNFFYSALTIILLSLLIRAFFLLNHYNKIIKNQSTDTYLKLNFLSVLKDDNITKAKKYFYAYNRVSELELRTIYTVFKSKKDQTDILIIIVDFFIKLAFPFVLWFLGILTIIPSTIAQLKILPDKSNQAILITSIRDFYIDILNTLGLGIVASILIILALITVNSLLSSFVREDIKLRLGVIEQVLESKFANKMPFLAQVESGSLLNESWQFEFVKFYNIPIKIIDIRGSVIKKRYVENLSNDKLYTTVGEEYIRNKFTFRVD